MPSGHMPLLAVCKFKRYKNDKGDCLLHNELRYFMLVLGSGRTLMRSKTLMSVREGGILSCSSVIKEMD